MISCASALCDTFTAGFGNRVYKINSRCKKLPLHIQNCLYTQVQERALYLRSDRTHSTNKRPCSLGRLGSWMIYAIICTKIASP